MKLIEEKEIIAFLREFNSLLENNTAEKYWKNLHCFPLALYDFERVYLSGYSKKLTGYAEKDGLLIGKWNSDFIGNTIIDLNGIPVVIWNLEHNEKYVALSRMMSYIFREGFHLYQKQIGEKRYADEFLAIYYPFKLKNIAARISERRNIMKAFYAKENKKELLKTFVSVREYRRRLIKTFFEYEMAQESIEGTATYIEYKSYSDLACLPIEFLVGSLGKDLLDCSEDLRVFKKSCYFTGAIMCLILDQMIPDWQQNYETSEDHLYDFFKKTLKLPDGDFVVIDHEDIETADELLKDRNREIDAVFNEFYSSKGQKIIMRGDLNLLKFDPMTITIKGNYFHSKNDLKAGYGKNKKISINKSCVAKKTKEISRITEIHIFQDKPPSIKGNDIILNEIGKLTGKIEIEKNAIGIVLK